MKVISAQNTLNLAPKIFLATIIISVLAAAGMVLAAMKLGYLAFQNGHLYFSQYKLVKVYGQIVNPAEIQYEAGLENNVQRAFPQIKQKSPAELNQAAQETVIRRKIMAAEAAKRNLTVTSSEIQTELNNRQKLMPQGSTLKGLLVQYHWSQDDLINQVSEQLLEQKVKTAIEGKADVLAIIIYPTINTFDKGLSIAQKAKKDLSNGKVIQHVINEATASGFLYGITVQTNQSEISPNQSSGWAPKIFEFLSSLNDKEIQILQENDNQGTLIVLGYAIHKSIGPNFDTWYAQQRTQAVSQISLNFPVAQPVYAGNFGPVWYNPSCGSFHPAGAACIDSTTYIFGGGLIGCASISRFYCSSSNQCCASYGYDTFCITIAGLQGRVYSDSVTMTPLSGVSITGRPGTSGGCDPSIWSGSQSTSTDANGYYSWPGSNYASGGFNCGGNPIGLTYTFGGNSRSQSVNVTNGTMTTAPNMYMNNPPPPPGTAKYLCSGTSCVRDDTNGWTTDPSCNGTCNPPPPPMGCVTVTSNASPNPVNTSSPISFSFTSGNGYTNVSLNTGGGASCGGVTVSGSGPYTWTWNCTSSGTAGNYTATFNNDQGCTGSVGYTINQPCIYPDSPTTPISPANGASQVPLVPTLSWTQGNWGNTPPYSVSVYLSPGGSGIGATYARCDEGQVTTAPINCFVWATGPNAGQAIASLNYGTTYSWAVTPRDGCGVQATRPDWTFTTIPTSYFQTFGGDVTAKGQATDTYLPANKYVCTKSQ